MRFQAADGGFLLVESDGCLRKVPSEHASDPRTRITLFPRDPLASIGKSNKRIRSGDWAFIVQGSAAALETELGIARADSDEMVEGPKYLVNEVARHDAIASSRPQGESSLVTDQQQLFNKKSQSHPSKQVIRKKQLAQAFPQETETMPPTVWCLASVSRLSESHQSSPSGDRLASHASLGEKHDHAGCLPHGAQIQLFQNSFVVCYELQSSKDDESNNNSRPMASVSASPGSTTSSSAHETQLSEGQPSKTSSSSLGDSSVSSSSIFTHLWLQETPSFATVYHPTSCSCSANNSSQDRKKPAIWDNTWTICDIKTDESRSSFKNLSLVASYLASDKPRRRSKRCTSTAEPLGGMYPTRLDTRTPDGEGELDLLSEQEEEVDDDVSEYDEEDPEGGTAGSTSLQRQLSVFDVERFSAKAETQQMRAARIIVRFFRRLFRNEATHSRVQDFLRRRRRLTHTKKHVETHLSTREQLKLLQCYNPNVFGSAKAWPRQQHQQKSIVSFDTFTNRAEHDRQKLATMKCDIAFLNSDWLRSEPYSIHKVRSSPQGDMYSRRLLSSPITPKRILANREREHHFHVEMKMAKRDPPNFHYGGFQAQAAMGQRPRTAPLTNDFNGAKLP